MYLITNYSGSRERNHDSTKLFSDLPENFATLGNEVTMVLYVDGHGLLNNVVLKHEQTFESIIFQRRTKVEELKGHHQSHGTSSRAGREKKTQQTRRSKSGRVNGDK